jgi:hypothetical protein
MGLLVRQEVELASTEMSHKATRAARQVATIAAGGLIVYAGVLAILAAVIIGLEAAGLDWWQSALLVGVLVAVAGWLIVQRGLAALKRADLAPRATLQTLKEDTRWAKEQIS